MRLMNQGFEILTDLNQEEILKHLEKCGRICYKSEHNIKEGSAEKFINMIIQNGHESVLEHFSISVKFYTDRGITHQIVRHRIASFSQESTRYCNYRKDKFNSEIVVIDPKSSLENDTKMKDLSIHLKNEIINTWTDAIEHAENAYMKLISLGATPQFARDVLPHAVKSEIVVTANIREWRHILKERTQKAAHPKIRELMRELLKELQRKLPVLFMDIK